MRHRKSSQAELDASNRRAADRRRVRIGWRADRVDFSDKELMARRYRRSRQRVVLRSGVPVGPLGYHRIIYRDSVILQADVQKGSFIAAWDLATGKQLWKTPRPDEILHVGNAQGLAYG